MRAIVETLPEREHPAGFRLEDPAGGEHDIARPIHLRLAHQKGPGGAVGRAPAPVGLAQITVKFDGDFVAARLCESRIVVPMKPGAEVSEAVILVDAIARVEDPDQLAQPFRIPHGKVAPAFGSGALHGDQAHGFFPAPTESTAENERLLLLGAEAEIQKLIP